jgi:hypothetical protein
MPSFFKVIPVVALLLKSLEFDFGDQHEIQFFVSVSAQGRLGG